MLSSTYVWQVKDWPDVLLPSRGFRAARSLWAAVCRRWFVIGGLSLHRLGELPHYTP